ncbi:hypothetical protein PITCH_A2160005 [uncultured Desulfobacterium sp.]|uniref:Uncharacterized protein n=1 Tax=uncultured Desulfobacterium sp. TaxID=201089 RepID=A0A445MXL5_9BACT|nr:hypothetical protein PITCH_A2160005 [uncultured Desulfobacterium sp.]
MRLIKEGFAIESNSNIGHYFKGKYIIPFDKGGGSDAESGFLPNYYVETGYFLDWSCASVMSLYQRANYSSAKANLRNPDYWFIQGLTYSARGVYSPSFRINSCSVFDSNGSSIFFTKSKDKKFLLQILGLLTSRFIRYQIKNYCGHTIATEVDELKGITLLENDIKFDKLINQITKAQKTNPRYDYASHEQIEIDRLVYEAYGLNADDIEEVENWFARRYPKLSAAQKENLRKLGKSDDYLVLYGYKKE